MAAAQQRCISSLVKLALLLYQSMHQDTHLLYLSCHVYANVYMYICK